MESDHEPRLPELKWEQFSVPWSEKELIVVWAVTPKDRQAYNQKHPAVREVADLIGRSPSAVDRKMANFWAVWQPGRGMAHISRLDEQVVERYRNHLDRLDGDANTIRAELYERRPTVRAEAPAPDDGDRRVDILQKLRSAARDEAGNEIGVHVYERRGSWYVGFFIDAYQVLSNPAVIPAYLVAAVAVYPSLKRSVTRLVVRIRDAAKFAAEVTHRILPDLEQEHFSRRDLEQIARQLTRFEVDPFHFNRRLAQAFHKLSITAVASEVEAFFHITAPISCPKCTIILGAAARRAIENARATT